LRRPIGEAAGQPEAIDAIANGTALTTEEQFECLLVIRDLTFPRGVAPLMQRLTALFGSAAGPSGRDQDTSLPLEPNGSLPTDMSLPQ
jgi:hypothetical protein